MKFTTPNMALFNRTLMMDNRHWQGYVFRLLLMGIIMLILFSIGAKSFFSAQASAVGREFFQSVSNTNLFFISIFGVTLFSSAITEEKEIDSLNLLLMTGIGPFTMLTSKSTSKLIVALMLIIAQFPFTLLAITLGGISMTQIVAVYLTLLSYTILVANIALFFSVVSRKSAQAAIFTFITLILINSLCTALPETRFLSPFIRTGEILRTGFTGNPLDCLQIWGSLALAGVFFMFSLLLFNPFSRQSSFPVPFRLPGTTKKSKVSFFRVGRVWKSALAWKEFHFMTGGTFGIILMSILMLIILLLATFIPLLDGQEPDREYTAAWFISIGLIFMFMEGIYISSGLFSKEVWNKTHSILMLLPMSIRQIAYRKIAGGVIIMLPNLFLVWLGFLLIADDLPLRNFTEISLFISISVLVLSMVIFYYHLVTFFSLFLKYGAFAVAAVVFYLLGNVLSMPLMIIPFLIGIFGFKGDWLLIAGIFMGTAISILASYFLHKFIGKKLINLASN